MKQYERYVYQGSAKWLYTWYEQNGVKRVEKKLLSNPTELQQRAIPRPSLPSRAKQVLRKSVLKSKPGFVPRNLQAGKKQATTSFDPSKPNPITTLNPKRGNLSRQRHPKLQPPPKAIKRRVRRKESRESVTKFEYLYGIKHLEIKHTQYENRSLYISKPINVLGNVMSVSLDAVEEHPLFDELNGAAADRQTSVEYYIASVGNNPSPTLEDWMPILPEEVKVVRSELLMFGTARTATLRFPARIGAKEGTAVYRNGLKLGAHEWSFADGGFAVQLLGGKDPVAVYTIDYTPNAEFYNPWILDLSKDIGTPVRYREEFPRGTDRNKSVTLSKYPYVDYKRINETESFDPNIGEYKPVQVFLKDAGIYGPNRTSFKTVDPYDPEKTQQVFTKNRSNYKSGGRREMQAYSLAPGANYNGFDYYQEKNKLFFTETFNQANLAINNEVSHGNATIVAEYEYLSSDFRMKIILRRNSTDENTLTPMVHEYVLKFKVMM